MPHERLRVLRRTLRERDAAPELFITVVEVRCGEPQAEQVALPVRLLPILILGPLVKDDRVLQELDVARTKLHVEVERRIVGGRLERLECRR